MSRPTDSSSSGPNGRGGAAYPSGTPPYGTGQYPSTTEPNGPGAATAPEESSVTTPAKPSTPDSDGPKTETTLTTRIRINIPGSRPIPPVVVRTPMPETAEPEPAPAAAPAPVAEEAPATGEEPASNWFAPRKAAPGPTPTSAAPAPAPTPAPVQGQAQGRGPAAGAPAGGSSAPRYDTPAQGFAQPPAGPRPGAPMGSGVGPGPGTGPRTGGPAGPGQGAPGQGYGQGPGQGPGYGQGPAQGPGSGQRPGAPALPAGPGAAYGPGSGAPAQGAPHPAGPGFAVPAGHRPGGPGVGTGVGTTQGMPPYGPGPAGPAGPTGGPALGTVPVGEAQEPRWPGPELGAGAAYPAPGPGPGPAPGVDRGPDLSAFPGPDPLQEVPAPAPEKKAKAPARPAKKGRSKLLLLAVAAVSLFGVAYGAGLLLNHSDVPKGTTVLDVDISGTRDEAVAKLQTAFGNRAAGPIQLTVGGKQVELKPEKAGLSLDSQTTVRNAAGSDYNPVTVIGSLFGSAREAEAVMPVDDEKLQVALQELAGTAGSATEGTITFDTGKAVAVPGKAGTTLDVGASADLVTKAFRDMVATGKATPVELPTATKDPVIDKAELDRAMKDFAEPAMSAPATVKVGAKSLPFGAKSLPKILSMQAVDGHLVEKYDLEALKATYGNTFDGILITRGTGEKTAVTPQDVAVALGKALRGKTTAERIAVIDTNPS
ncbi:hypothetical protein [Streptomyces sp. NBC_00503]|uniref:hypothetical protein n=1 Tax=Streptomyces sp. NBC_00503 TaxID=2903659 RepID=UPI003FCC9F44|nr:hypothetical protein OG490_24310 [Streptomyces sp. NBC_00503]